MIRCAQCGAEIQKAKARCTACGHSAPGRRPRAKAMTTGARGPAIEGLPPLPDSDLLGDPRSRRPAPRPAGPPPQPPVSGQYEPPKYSPPIVERRNRPPVRRSRPPVRQGERHPVRLPAAFIVVVVVVIAALGLGATALRRTTKADSAAMTKGSALGAWAPWASPDGIYLVAFPGRPIYETRPAITDAAGTRTLTSDTTLDLGAVTYVVTTTQLSPATRLASTDAQLLTEAVEALRAGRPGLDVTADPAEPWAGMATMTIEGTLPGHDDSRLGVHGRVAVHGSHVFVLLVTERDMSANAEKFLGSFQVIG